MQPAKGFFDRPTGYFFILGVSLFAVGLAAGSRTLWIVGVCLVAFSLLTGLERPRPR